MAFQAHSQDEAHVWWPSSVFCLEVLCIWSSLREDWNTFKGISGSIPTCFFAQGRGKRSLTPWAAMKTATLPNCRLRNIPQWGGKLQNKVINFSKNGTYQLSRGVKISRVRITCTCMSEVDWSGHRIHLTINYNVLRHHTVSFIVSYNYCAHKFEQHLQYGFARRDGPCSEIRYSAPSFEWDLLSYHCYYIWCAQFSREHTRISKYRYVYPVQIYTFLLFIFIDFSHVLWENGAPRIRTSSL